MKTATMSLSRDPKHQANVRLAMILGTAALLCYLGIYLYYVLQSP
jgi:hypothetical protein